MLGAFGGLMSFLNAVRNNQIRNNQRIVKGAIEIVGGTIMATVTSEPVFLLLVSSTATQLLVPFAIGLTWSQIIQRIRKWITSLVGKALDNQKREDDNERKKRLRPEEHKA